MVTQIIKKSPRNISNSYINIRYILLGWGVIAPRDQRKVIRTQGKENAFWVIMDYGDIVVHIFQTPYRAFYRLEDLWADAERTVYED